MSNELKNKINEIINKKFSKKIYSGYDPEDVDLFFDNIISYINEINVIVNTLDKNNKDLNEKIKQMNILIEERNQAIKLLNEEISSLKKEGYHNQRVIKEQRELDKRISQLESQNKK